MTGDASGRRGDPAAPERGILAQRSGSDFVAPITLGRPYGQTRYLRSARAVDAGVLGSAPIVYLVWREVVSLPLLATVGTAVVLAAIGHWGLRCRLHHLRRRGRAISTLLAVGAVDDIAALVAHTRRHPGLGWRIGGACTPTGAGPWGAPTIAGVPVIGDLDTVAAQALSRQFDAVSAGPAPGWTAIRLQQLAWDLDCSRTALLVDPRLVPRVGPRVRVTEADGLPLLRVEHPGMRGVPRLVKGTMDRLCALLVLVLMAPLLLGFALAVRQDGGHALERRRRVGRGGQEFTLLMFRTTGNDGRPTRVGQILQRHCLDELPQLLNVLGGSMSLVGPRPPDPKEDLTSERARRCMLVKPGVTGLWQVDAPASDDSSIFGASDLDLRYVTHWTPALDARILVKTVRAALSSADIARSQP